MQGLSLLPHSVLKHQATIFRIISNPFILEVVTSLLQNPYLGGPGFLFRVSFLQTGWLPWLMSFVYLPLNPGKGPLPGVTHWAQGRIMTPAVGLSLLRIPACTF
jgi:hypothetical protein